MKKGLTSTIALGLAFLMGWVGGAVYQAGGERVKVSSLQSSNQVRPVSSLKPSSQNLSQASRTSEAVYAQQGISSEAAREILLQEGIVLPPHMLEESMVQGEGKISSFSLPDEQAEANLLAEMEAHARFVEEMKAAGKWPPKPVTNQAIILPPDDWMQTNRFVEDQM